MILLKTHTKITLYILLPAVFLISGHVLAHEPSQDDQPASPERKLSAPTPDLTDILPLVAKLTGRLAALEKRIRSGLDLSAIEKKFHEIEANLQNPAGQLQRLKDLKDYKSGKLVALREAIKRENELLEEDSKPLNQAIRQLGGWRKEWLAEKKLWNEWQSSLLEEGELPQLKSAFEKANKTIDRALNLVLLQLDAMLAVQEKGGHIQVKLDALAAELDGLIVEERRGALLDASPPMFSPQYFSQFGKGEMWYAVQKGLDDITWPDSRFFSRQGWIIFIQFFLSLFAIIAIYRKRHVFQGTERWRFLAARPFAAGLFLGCMTTLLIYEYDGAPAMWKLVNTIIAGISFVRLIDGLIGTFWKRQFVYGLVIVLIITTLLEVLSFPLPLFRLFTVFTALVGLFFCLRWAGENSRSKGSGFYTVLLRLGSLLFAVILIAELWGKKALASYILTSLIDSIATVFVFVLFMYMIHGGLEWLFRKSPLQRAAVQNSDTDAIIYRVARIIDVALGSLVLLPAVLMIWGLYDGLEGATKGVLALGVNLGSQRISFGLLITAAGILYGSFLLSSILQKLIKDEVLLRRGVEKGVRYSIGRLLHYVLIFAGFLFAISTLGFEITKLTIILSALGVGIGFGLQNVVSNFVSGLILLFERPVRVGDTVEIGGKWSEIKRIGLRATTVQTVDQADVIIPNADLVTNQVTNWTLSNRQVRLIIPVDVAYGSDVTLVMETLAACAKDHDMVIAFRTPQVLFLGFGESSLDFELRIWLSDADHRLRVQSELHQEIDRRFREANIEIPFPQRDLHLRSVDDSINLHPQETAG